MTRNITIASLACIATLWMIGCSENQPSAQKQTASKTTAQTPATETTAPAKTTTTTPAAQKKGSSNMIVIQTSKGNIVVELNEEKAPITVKNFLSYVDDGQYDNTIFHRVINGFMIQGGGFTDDMRKKPTKAPIKNEADNGLTNDRGTIAMARTQIVDSATSQFFINVNDNDSLNHRGKTTQGYGYCVFGKVVEGMEVVDAIRTVPTGTDRRSGMRDVPKQPIIIEKISRK